ncbi:hypothetical protein [Bradyrhizobium sp. CCBAU 53340]|uniref:hypothetical protein n=1 Tax=Bradyrhizobium sp. CCBAU 53340 TaxID=1325112 RepID=UPI00188D0871|nr:hypothetical protein [Bradyrhizobium sp. CCBAU 53340]
MADLTKVLKAIDEFDKLGRDGFLTKYGFGKSHRYFVRHKAKPYDSKAIAGVAHGRLGKGFLTWGPADFFGDAKTVAKRLWQPGFTVSNCSVSHPVGIPFEVGRLYHRKRDKFGDEGFQLPVKPITICTMINLPMARRTNSSYRRGMGRPTIGHALNVARLGLPSFLRKGAAILQDSQTPFARFSTFALTLKLRA